jgi:hypothetical protein
MRPLYERTPMNRFTIGYFTGVLATVGITLSLFYAEYRKISKRMKRNENFLLEMETWKKVYQDCPENRRDEAIFIFKAIVDHYSK